jgi:hypothetical protein
MMSMRFLALVATKFVVTTLWLFVEKFKRVLLALSAIAIITLL